ncbi:hypothetical protein [Neisseria sp. Ec49-e6-T10]|uniref:hypothetical protein n=1 Tax=Neisseria sp. Ec49-e6-T10 TaxID=3140744 RepID=UPI003EBFB6EE
MLKKLINQIKFWIDILLPRWITTDTGYSEKDGIFTPLGDMKYIVAMVDCDHDWFSEVEYVAKTTCFNLFGRGISARFNRDDLMTIQEWCVRNKMLHILNK